MKTIIWFFISICVADSAIRVSHQYNFKEKPKNQNSRNSIKRTSGGYGAEMDNTGVLINKYPDTPPPFYQMLPDDFMNPPDYNNNNNNNGGGGINPPTDYSSGSFDPMPPDDFMNPPDYNNNNNNNGGGINPPTDYSSGSFDPMPPDDFMNPPDYYNNNGDINPSTDYNSDSFDPISVPDYNNNNGDNNNNQENYENNYNQNLGNNEQIDEEMPPDYVSSDSGYLPPGYIAPPGISRDGWHLLPDGNYVKYIVETEAPIAYEVPISPVDNPEILPVGEAGSPGYHDIIGIGEPNIRSYFKRTPGPSGKPDDYTLEPIVSPRKPIPVNPKLRNRPRVIYPEGRNNPPTLMIGPEGRRKYFKMVPNDDKPGGYDFIPRIKKGSKIPEPSHIITQKPQISETTEETELTTTELLEPPTEEVTESPDNYDEEPEFDDLPENPQFETHRPGTNHPFTIISLGPKNHRQHFKKIPRSRNPNDYDLEPYDPNTPNHKVNPRNPYAPKVLNNGIKGTPQFSPVIKTGQPHFPKFYRLVPHPNNPNQMGFVPVTKNILKPGNKKPTFSDLPRQFKPPRRRRPEEVRDDEPDDGEPEFSDLPEEPHFKTVKQPKRHPYTLISVGKPPHKNTFKKTPGKSGNPNDYTIEPFDSDTPNNEPDQDNPDPPKVHPHGEKGKPNYSPVIEYGPHKHRKFFRLVPHPTHPNHFGFIPVKKVNTKKGPHFQDLPRKYQPHRIHSPTTHKPHEGSKVFDDLPDDPSIITRHLPGRRHPTQIISVGKPPHRRHFEKKPGPSGDPDDYVIEPFDPKNPNKKPNPHNPKSPKVYHGKHPVIKTGSPQKPKYFRVEPDPNHPHDPNRVKFTPVKPLKKGKNPTFVEIPRRFHIYHTTPKSSEVTTTEPEDDEPVYDYQPERVKIKNIHPPHSKYPYQIISIGKPPNRQHFLKKPGPSKKPYDYTIEPYDPKTKDHKPHSKNPPKVYPAKGIPGNPDYQPPVIRVGPKNKPKYYKLKPDPKHPHDPRKIKFIPVIPVPHRPGKFQNLPYHYYHRTTTKEPDESDIIFDDLPENPEVKELKRPHQKIPSQIISVGKPPYRKHFEKKPNPSGKPDDFEIYPFDPMHPNKKPKPSDDVFPATGKPGTSKYQPPVIKTGSPQKPKYFRIIPNPDYPNDPKKIIFIPVKPLKRPDSHKLNFIPLKRHYHIYHTTTKKHPKPPRGQTPEPYDGEPIFVDQPENPKVFQVKDPKHKRPVQIIAVGKKPHRQYFKKIPGPSHKPDDYRILPFDPRKPNGKPDPKDKSSPKVYPGPPPVIEYGPKHNRKTFKLVPDPKHPNDPTKINFIPVKKISNKPYDNKPHFQNLPRLTRLYHRTTKHKHPKTTAEPQEGDIVFTDEPYKPKIYTVKEPGRKHPVQIIAVGKPPNRKYFKKVPKPNDPNDFILYPYDPQNPHENPNPEDDKTPKVYPGDKNPRKPKHRFPVIETGTPQNPNFYEVVPDPKHPGKVNFVPVIPVKNIEKPEKPLYFIKPTRKFYRYTKSKKTTTPEPKEGEPQFIDVPDTKVEQKVVPGYKKPVQIVEVGERPYTKKFVKIPGPSKHPDDYILKPFDRKHPEKNPKTPKVYGPFGKPNTPDYHHPVIEFQPNKFFEVKPNPKYPHDPKKIILVPVKPTKPKDKNPSFVELPRKWYCYHTTFEPEKEIIEGTTNPEKLTTIQEATTEELITVNDGTIVTITEAELTEELTDNPEKKESEVPEKTEEPEFNSTPKPNQSEEVEEPEEPGYPKPQKPSGTGEAEEPERSEESEEPGQKPRHPKPHRPGSGGEPEMPGAENEGPEEPEKPREPGTGEQEKPGEPETEEPEYKPRHPKSQRPGEENEEPKEPEKPREPGTGEPEGHEELEKPGEPERPGNKPRHPKPQRPGGENEEPEEPEKPREPEGSGHKPQRPGGEPGEPEEPGQPEEPGHKPRHPKPQK
nr:slime protein [Eoperipatus sp.]